MRLKNLNESIFDESIQKNAQENKTKLLESNLENIKKCSEFTNCDLRIIKSPVIEDVNGVVYKVKDYLVNDSINFSGAGYLYNITKTPPIYNEGQSYDPVKNGACITPTKFDPQTLQPIRNILIQFNPEKTKEDMIALLSDILENPSDYTRKADFQVIVRGVFENVSSESITGDQFNEQTKLPEFNLDPETYKNFSVFLLTPQYGEDDEMWMSLEHRLYPNTVKDIFDKMVNVLNFNTLYKEVCTFEMHVKQIPGYTPTIVK